MRSFGIGIDLGGTRIKAAAFDLATGRVLQEASAPTRDGEESEGGPAFLAEVRGLVARFEQREGTTSAVVGVSSPGFANREASHIVSMPGRLAGLEGLEWPEALQRPAAVLNDAHAALMGEIWQGAAAGVMEPYEEKAAVVAAPPCQEMGVARSAVAGRPRRPAPYPATRATPPVPPSRHRRPAGSPHRAHCQIRVLPSLRRTALQIGSSCTRDVAVMSRW